MKIHFERILQWVKKSDVLHMGLEDLYQSYLGNKFYLEI